MSPTPAPLRPASALAVGGIAALSLALACAPLASAATVAPPGSALQAAKDGTQAPAVEQPSAADLKALTASKIGASLKQAQGEAKVFVRFSGEGAFAATQDAKVRQGKAQPRNRSGEVKKLRERVKKLAASAAKQAGATQIYSTSNTVPGVALQGDAAALRALAERSDVVSVSALVPKTLDNAGTDLETQAAAVWQKYSQTGEGVTIAVMDTGVDYTHTDFGGPGTAEAFAQATALKTFPSADSGLYDPKKFKGGWDLVGDDYNADPSSASYQPIPKPDGNPIDCKTAGHGSHVAGTAGGYGVNADGSTFRGDYAKLDKAALSKMKIGPGSAPLAGIVSLRVFGCAGSTDVTGAALDRVLDPNGDGNFDDAAQIVNMSLSGAHAPTDDPDTLILNKLTEQGVLSVNASGNGYDITDTGGSPGNAASALTVANTIGSVTSADPATVTAPAALAGDYPGQFSVNFTGTKAVSAPVVVPKAGLSTTGCEPFASENFAGKIVWLHYTDDPTGATSPCGSAVRYNNVEAAGGVGVVMDAPQNTFAIGIAGNATIPGVQITKDATAKLSAAAAAGELALTIDPSRKGSILNEAAGARSLNASSSRGVHGSNGIVKPDVAAPGTSILSVAVGSGTGGNLKTGTSMATPHTAGIAALVAASGNYSATQLKAKIMNTAADDVFRNGVAYGPQRVGSGFVRAQDAIDTPVIAWDKDRPTGISSVFGVIEAERGVTTLTRTIRLSNLSTKARTYKAAYLESTSMPGVSYSLDKATVTVPSKGIADVKVTLRIDGSALEKTRDATMDAVQSGLARSWVADATGRVQFTSEGLPTLRVPVQAAPKPVSAVKASAKAVAQGKTATVKFSGTGVDQGSGENAFLSKASLFTLGEQSKRLPASLDASPAAREMDLRAVGANSTAPAEGIGSGVLSVGVATWKNWAHIPGGTEIRVEFDTNGDGVADFTTTTARPTNVDLSVAVTKDKTGRVLETRPLNDAAGDVDTNTYDTNVASLPVSLKTLGVTSAANAKISYRVLSFSDYYRNAEGKSAPVDSTAWIGYDAAKPPLAVLGSGTTYTALPGLTVPVKVNTAGSQLLVLHLLNGSGDLSAKAKAQGGRSQVISLG